MEDDRVLKIARQHYQSGVKDPLPFPLTEQWRNNQERMAEAIQKFTSAEEAVHWAQRSQNSGFDHRYQEVRENERNVIAQKRVLLEERFHGFDLASSGFKESSYSLPSSIHRINTETMTMVGSAGSVLGIISTPVGGIPVSNILFWHLNQYLAVTWWVYRRPSSVVEIGGGYGGLARLFLSQKFVPFYTIIDLPESLFFSECFLRLTTGDTTRVAYAGCEGCPQRHGLKLATPHRSAFMAARYEVAIAAASMQEMDEGAVHFWLSFISRVANNFYSLNYASTPCIGDGGTSPEHYLGDGWKRHILERNPAVVTVDAVADWVELLCAKARNP